MTLEEQIVAALREAQNVKPLLDTRAGRNYLLSLTRAFGGNVEDETDYKLGRSYRYVHSIPTEEDRRFRTVLQVNISGVGPFASHTVTLRVADQRWWAHNIRTSRNGFYPEDAEAILRLRNWYRENEVVELDARAQAQFAPKDLVPGDEEVTFYQLLFKG